MKPGNISLPTVNHAVKRENVGVDSPSIVACKSDAAYDDNWPSLSASNSFGTFGKRKTRVDLKPHVEQKSDEGSGNLGTFSLESSPVEDSTSQQYYTSLPTSFGKKNKAKQSWKFGTSPLENSPVEDSTSQHYDYDSFLPTSFGKKSKAFPYRSTKQNQKFSAMPVGIKYSDPKEGSLPVEPFDIFHYRSIKSLSKRNIDKRVEKETNEENPNQILRSGMVLLKNYISLRDQMEIVNKCRELGIGPGGFYQPGYQDGRKLRLQMMCLGRNWDPETKYQEQQGNDGSDPPSIPNELVLLVKNALQDSHTLIKENDEASNVEEILPTISPDICIVNFYTTTGRLGLHQDRDESPDSLDRRLPVVSFSIGDSAEFLYGDKRDVDKAEEVLLESGDVLIFGGKSRHVFHGVKSIIPESAPLPLLKQTMLHPGRLNLTFRQF